MVPGLQNRNHLKHLRAVWSDTQSIDQAKTGAILAFARGQVGSVTAALCRAWPRPRKARCASRRSSKTL